MEEKVNPFWKRRCLLLNNDYDALYGMMVE
jgi:hypothetical protein